MALDLLSIFACWNIVKMDVMVAVREFFQGNSLPRFYFSSFIVLIPKERAQPILINFVR